MSDGYCLNDEYYISLPFADDFNLITRDVRKHKKLMVDIHILFNAMIQHCYVPFEFLRGSITPLIKDSQGDHSSTDNYRALTLSVLLSNLFEHALLMKIVHLLTTDNLQIGYKKRHSISHAIHTLKTTIDYCESHQRFT